MKDNNPKRIELKNQSTKTPGFNDSWKKPKKTQRIFRSQYSHSKWIVTKLTKRNSEREPWLETRLTIKGQEFSKYWNYPQTQTQRSWNHTKIFFFLTKNGSLQTKPSQEGSKKEKISKITEIEEQLLVRQTFRNFFEGWFWQETEGEWELRRRETPRKNNNNNKERRENERERYGERRKKELHPLEHQVKSASGSPLSLCSQ